jgi:hypothetical protein
MGSPAESSQESVVAGDGEGRTKYSPDGEEDPSSPIEQDDSNEDSSAAETEKSNKANETPEGKTSISIPVIEVSNDNDKDALRD